MNFQTQYLVFKKASSLPLIQRSLFKFRMIQNSINLFSILIQMTQVLRCCSLQSLNEPYIGVDQKCSQLAIFCIQHSPHKNSQGLIHQMLPLKHFKKILHEKKFKMNQKIGILTDQYNNLMDALIQQIKQLKLRKNIQLSMLWLRQLAKDEQQYELMRQIYRMDFKDLTCSLIHSIYFKIVHNQILESKSVKQINCYRGISQILDYLSQQKQTRSFLSKKISEIEGIMQNGQILKRALPDKMVYKQNIKQVLLQSLHVDSVQIKYNKCKLTRSSRRYMSIFSKYPLVPHVVYHINFSTKYTNVMLGISTENLVGRSNNIPPQPQIQSQDQSQVSNLSSQTTQFDKHYSKQSIVFNCTNGCIYKNGMFESGSNSLTKGQKQLVLKMRVTATNQMIIMLGKSVLCRQKIDLILSKNGVKNKLFLHVLLRTEGDSFDVDRDKDITSDQLPAKIQYCQKNSQQSNQQHSRQNLNFQQIKRRNQQQSVILNNINEQIISQKHSKDDQSQINQSGSFSYDSRHINQNKLMFSKNDQSSQQILTKKDSSLKNNKLAVHQQVKKIERKRQQMKQQKRPGNLTGLNQNTKQQKINELIKKERMDKILNSIKSKPVPNCGRANATLAKKVKQIQQKNGSRPNLRQTSQQGQIHNSSQEYSKQKSRQIYKIRYLKSDISKQTPNPSSQNIPSPVLKYAQINPLLVVRKAIKQSATSQKSILFPSGVFSQYNIPVSQHEAQDQSKKLRPQQKNFKLVEDQSYDFQQMGSEMQYTPMNGGFTPMDKMNQFQFLKRSISQKSCMKENSPFKPKFDNVEEKIQKQYGNRGLAVLQESSQNLQHSGSFKRNDQSQVLESQQIQNFDNNTELLIRVNNGQKVRMPELKQSHFSKITSKSNLQDHSNLDSSFGADQKYYEKKNERSEHNIQVTNNPMDAMALLQSVIDIKSDYKSDLEPENNLFAPSVQIGSIISPKTINTDLYLNQSQSEIIDDYFQKAGDRQQDLYLINQKRRGQTLY